MSKATPFYTSQVVRLPVCLYREFDYDLQIDRLSYRAMLCTSQVSTFQVVQIGRSYAVAVAALDPGSSMHRSDHKPARIKLQLATLLVYLCVCSTASTSELSFPTRACAEDIVRRAGRLVVDLGLGRAIKELRDEVRPAPSLALTSRPS